MRKWIGQKSLAFYDLMSDGVGTENRNEAPDRAGIQTSVHRVNYIGGNLTLVD